MKVVAIDIGKRNFAYAGAVLREEEDWPHVFSMGVEDLTIGDSRNIYRNLITYLDTLKHIWEECDIVLIEQQLNMMNIQATKISCHVQAYFMHKYPYKSVMEYPSTYKTRLEPGLEGKKTTHRQRKQFAIAKVMDYYQENDPVLYDWIMALRKKDDVSDCILMCKTFVKSSLYEKERAKQKTNDQII